MLNALINSLVLLPKIIMQLIKVDCMGSLCRDNWGVNSDLTKPKIYFSFPNVSKFSWENRGGGNPKNILNIFNNFGWI